MRKTESRVSPRLSRRRMLRLLGLSGGLGMLGGLGSAHLSAWQAASKSRKVTFPKGAVIRAILKDVQPEDLTSGSILFHEHLSLNTAFFKKLLGARGANIDPNKPWFTEDESLISEEMRAAAKDGVSLIVDAGHADQGRSVEFLKKVSQNSGMPIVVSGGYYLPSVYPPEVAAMTEDQLADAMARDAKAERWGALGEIGSGEELTADELKVFRAIGKTQTRTNLPIHTHTDNGKGAVAQLDALEAGGAKPQHIVIGHLGGGVMPSIEVHKTICKRGAFVGFDRVGGRPEADAKQVAMIQELVEAGYANNIMLSSDFSSEAQTKSKGGPGYAKTLTVFVPMLLKAGMKEETVRGFLLDNSRRFLAFVPKS
jgi:predicted metal-dependent phosphotriesterase family hydrolase